MKTGGRRVPLGRRLPSGERLHASTVPAVVRLLLSSREGELYVKVNCLRGRCGPHSIRGAGCVCCGSGVRIPSHHRRKQAMSVEGRRDVSSGGAHGGGVARSCGCARGVALSLWPCPLWREQRGVTGPTPVPDASPTTQPVASARVAGSLRTHNLHTSTTGGTASRDRVGTVHLPLRLSPMPIF